MIVVSGENKAYTLKYLIDCLASSPVAPKECKIEGARRNSSIPKIVLDISIVKQESEKILDAFSNFFSPNKIAILTEEPNPIKSAKPKFKTTIGIVRLKAANAVSPRSLLKITPSKNRYIAEASIPIEPGMAALKNSFKGGVFSNKVIFSIKTP